VRCTDAISGRGRLAGGSCNPLSDGIATFLTTPSNSANVAGTCAAGYANTNGNPPRRSCQADLTWTPVSNQCTRTPLSLAQRRSLFGALLTRVDGWTGASCTGLACASTTDDVENAFFNGTFAGLPMAGTCLPGYAPNVVPPSRTCLITGVWSATTGGCTRTGHPMYPC
jgi:hypothetical protein